ncbi:hypothetical protein DFAR_1110091 [Desulfarculales bacterium]
MVEFPKYILSDLFLNGFRLLKKFRAKVGALEVLVGANGSGKSVLSKTGIIAKNDLIKTVNYL